jgi:hypothetical protein
MEEGSGSRSDEQNKPFAMIPFSGSVDDPNPHPDLDPDPYL